MAFFFSSRRRHTRLQGDWSSDVCSSDLTGMAWTEMGGEVLFIEATLLPGGRGLTITGQLGEVMQESARAAQSYLWSHEIGRASCRGRKRHWEDPVALR